MSANYDQIATVNIDIATTVVPTADADSILIVGPLPKVAPEESPSSCGIYSSLEQVLAAGWAYTGDDPDPVGIAAYLAFAQNPAPQKIYIAPIQETDGTAEYAVETVKRATAVSGWYGVCPAGVDSDELESLAEYIETQEKVLIYTELDFFNSEDPAPLLADTFYRTIGIYGRVSPDQEDEDIPEYNKYINVAFAVAWFAYDSGSETTAFKTLYKVEPSDLTEDEMASLKSKNLNYFISVGSRNVTMNGMVLGGEWCDIIRFRDWLKSDMQTAVVNTFLANPKIPYTDGGIALIESAVQSSLQRGQARGGIMEDSFDEDGATENPGYRISVPAAIDIPDEDKAARVLNGIKFTARLTGAIHFAEITGSLAYSL